jgi:hypothetical protein
VAIGVTMTLLAVAVAGVAPIWNDDLNWRIAAAAAIIAWVFAAAIQYFCIKNLAWTRHMDERFCESKSVTETNFAPNGRGANFSELTVYTMIEGDLVYSCGSH